MSENVVNSLTNRFLKVPVKGISFFIDSLSLVAPITEANINSEFTKFNLQSLSYPMSGKSLFNVDNIIITGQKINHSIVSVFDSIRETSTQIAFLAISAGSFALFNFVLFKIFPQLGTSALLGASFIISIGLINLVAAKVLDISSNSLSFSMIMILKLISSKRKEDESCSNYSERIATISLIPGFGINFISFIFKNFTFLVTPIAGILLSSLILKFGFHVNFNFVNILSSYFIPLIFLSVPLSFLFTFLHIISSLSFFIMIIPLALLNLFLKSFDKARFNENE